MFLSLNHASCLSQFFEGMSKHVDDWSTQCSILFSPKAYKKLPNILEETKVIRSNMEGPFLD